MAFNKEVEKEGTGNNPIELEYKLTCDKDYTVEATLSPATASSWVSIVGGGNKEGVFEISISKNDGSSRNVSVYPRIYNNEHKLVSECTSKGVFISQKGDGGSSECSFEITITNPSGGKFETCDAGTLSFDYVKKGESPTPTECDGRITIHGNSTVTCDVMTTTLTAETTETCDVSGDYKENNPYSAVGSSGHLVKIGAINSGCEGSTDSWSFTHFDGEDVVDISSIRVLNGNEVHGIIKQNPTDVKRHENVRATCSSGCMDEFAIWQNGGSSACEGITIQGSNQVTCDTMTTTLTATTNNQ